MILIAFFFRYILEFFYSVVLVNGFYFCEMVDLHNATSYWGNILVTLPLEIYRRVDLHLYVPLHILPALNA